MPMGCCVYSYPVLLSSRTPWNPPPFHQGHLYLGNGVKVGWVMLGGVLRSKGWIWSGIDCFCPPSHALASCRNGLRRRIFKCKGEVFILGKDWSWAEKLNLPAKVRTKERRDAERWRTGHKGGRAGVKHRLCDIKPYPVMQQGGVEYSVHC